MPAGTQERTRTRSRHKTTEQTSAETPPPRGQMEDETMPTTPQRGRKATQPTEVAEVAYVLPGDDPAPKCQRCLGTGFDLVGNPCPRCAPMEGAV